MASDYKKLFSPLQLESTVNSATNRYLLNLPIDHINASAFNKNICLDFSSGEAIVIQMKEIGNNRITHRELSNSHFPTYISCDSLFIDSNEFSDFRMTATMLLLYHYVLI